VEILRIKYSNQQDIHKGKAMSKCKRKKIARVIGWKIAQKAMRDARIKREKREAARKAKDGDT